MSKINPLLQNLPINSNLKDSAELKGSDTIRVNVGGRNYEVTIHGTVDTDTKKQICELFKKSITNEDMKGNFINMLTTMSKNPKKTTSLQIHDEKNYSILKPSLLPFRQKKWEFIADKTCVAAQGVITPPSSKSQPSPKSPSPNVNISVVANPNLPKVSTASARTPAPPAPLFHPAPAGNPAPSPQPTPSSQNDPVQDPAQPGLSIHVDDDDVDNLGVSIRIIDDDVYDIEANPEVNQTATVSTSLATEQPLGNINQLTPKQDQTVHDKPSMDTPKIPPRRIINLQNLPPRPVPTAKPSGLPSPSLKTATASGEPAADKSLVQENVNQPVPEKGVAGEERNALTVAQRAELLKDKPIFSGQAKPQPYVGDPAWLFGEGGKADLSTQAESKNVKVGQEKEVIIPQKQLKPNVADQPPADFNDLQLFDSNLQAQWSAQTSGSKKIPPSSKQTSLPLSKGSKVPPPPLPPPTKPLPPPPSTPRPTQALSQNEEPAAQEKAGNSPLADAAENSLEAQIPPEAPLFEEASRAPDAPPFEEASRAPDAPPFEEASRAPDAPPFETLEAPVAPLNPPVFEKAQGEPSPIKPALKSRGTAPPVSLTKEALDKLQAIQSATRREDDDDIPSNEEEFGPDSAPSGSNPTSTEASTLPKVSTTPTPKKESSSKAQSVQAKMNAAKNTNDRDSFLKAIRDGKALKKVEDKEKPQSQDIPKSLSSRAQEAIDRAIAQAEEQNKAQGADNDGWEE